MPLTLISKGFSSASLLAMLITPLRVPAAVGAKVTVKVVVASAASVVTAGCVMVKSPVFETTSPVRSLVPVFLIVNVCALLVLPTLVLAKVKVPVLSVCSLPTSVLSPSKTAISGAGSPVPARMMS